MRNEDEYIAKIRLESLLIDRLYRQIQLHYLPFKISEQ